MVEKVSTFGLDLNKYAILQTSPVACSEIWDFLLYLLQPTTENTTNDLMRFTSTVYLFLVKQLMHVTLQFANLFGFDKYL